MTVLIFIKNDQVAAGEYCKANAKAQYPGASIGFRNPKYYKASEHEKADAVYVEDGQDQVVKAYEDEDTPVNRFVFVNGITRIVGDDDDVLYTNRYDAEIERLTAYPVTQIRNALSRITDKELLRAARQAESDGKNRKMAIDAYDYAIGELR